MSISETAISGLTFVIKMDTLQPECVDVNPKIRAYEEKNYREPFQGGMTQSIPGIRLNNKGRHPKYIVVVLQGRTM